MARRKQPKPQPHTWGEGHAWVQPTFVVGDLTRIRMQCPCGWTSAEVRPEEPHALERIKAELGDHIHASAVVGGRR